MGVICKKSNNHQKCDEGLKSVMMWVHTSEMEIFRSLIKFDFSHQKTVGFQVKVKKNSISSSGNYLWKYAWAPVRLNVNV